MPEGNPETGREDLGKVCEFGLMFFIIVIFIFIMFLFSFSNEFVNLVGDVLF